VDPIVAIVAAIIGVITGLGGLLVSWQTARSTSRKAEVEALSMALDSLREDYTRLDKMVNKLQIEVAAWKRRFRRVCELAGIDPDNQITRPLGRRPAEDEAGG